MLIINNHGQKNKTQNSRNRTPKIRQIKLHSKHAPKTFLTNLSKNIIIRTFSLQIYQSKNIILNTTMVMWS